MITRITTLVAAVVVSGGILSSVTGPAEAKAASLKSGISISREAKLIRVIRVKLAGLKAKRVATEKVLVEARPGNGTGRVTRSVEKVEAGNLAATRGPRIRAQ
jgi:hypothetical protein